MCARIIQNVDVHVLGRTYRVQTENRFPRLRNGWKKGEAQVEAASGRIRVRTSQARFSTSKAAHIRRIAPANGYRKSN